MKKKLLAQLVVATVAAVVAAIIGAIVTVTLTSWRSGRDQSEVGIELPQEQEPSPAASAPARAPERTPSIPNPPVSTDASQGGHLVDNISSEFKTPPSEQPPRSTRRLGKVKEEASEVAELESSKYLNLREPQGAVAALVAEDSSPQQFLSQRIADAIGGRGDLFTPSFLRDGLLDRILAGDLSVISELGLQHCSRLILGRAQLNTFRSSIDSHFTEAELLLTIVDIRCTTRASSRTLTLRSTGAGLTVAEAKQSALEKVVPKMKQSLLKQ